MYLFTLFLIFLLFATIILVVALYVFPLKLSGAANSEQLPEYRMVFTWLKPLLKCTVEKNDDVLFLEIYLFNRKVLSREVKKQISPRKDILKTLKEMKLNSMRMNASYGFEDPSVTGMVFGAVNLVSDYLNIDVEYNHPDFYVMDDYFSLKFSAEAKPIDIIMSMMKTKRINPQYGGR